MTRFDRTRETRLHCIMGQLRRRLGQGAAGISTFTLAITVAALAMAQQQNIYEKPTGSRFKAAPKPPGAEGEAEAASAGLEVIMGVHVNTLFFVATGVIALFWFTIGGGRKPKVTRR